MNFHLRTDLIIGVQEKNAESGRTRKLRERPEACRDLPCRGPNWPKPFGFSVAHVVSRY